MCLLGCLALGALALFAPALYQFSLSQSSLNVGTAAPDFELPALNGGMVSLSQFRGRPVILSFSASWCPDCRRGAPLLQDLHATYPTLVVLMVDSGETQAEARQFASDFGLTHPILLDRDRAVLSLYQVFAIPTELFIDSDGVIRAKLIEGVTPKLLADRLPLIGVNP